MQRVDEHTFIQAYDAHAESIFRYCYFKVYDRERARELMQETFLNTWTYIRKEEEISNLQAFLYKVAHNLCVNEVVRKKPLSLEELKEATGYDPEDTLPSPEETAEQSEVLEKLDLLQDSDREVLILRYVEGLAVKDIAAMLNDTPNAVSVRIHRALERLKEELSP